MGEKALYSDKSSGWVLYLTGIALLFLSALVSYQSHAFVFDVSSLRERPIPGVVALLLLAFFFYLIAVNWVRQHSKLVEKRPMMIGWIIFVSILCRFLFLPSQMIQEVDAYRYVWDGQSVLHAVNPYLQSPQEAMAGSSAAFLETPEAVSNYEKINYPEFKTIYPPLAQVLFAVSQALTPWQLGGWKFMIFVSEITILLILLFLLKKRGVPKGWILLYGWSPLVIKEFSNSLHLDIFAILLICGMCLAFAHHRLGLAVLLLSFATLIKWYAVIFFPFVLVWGWQKGKIDTLSCAGIYLFSLFAFFVPFHEAGIKAFESLGLFLGYWEVNGSIFVLVDWLCRLFPVPASLDAGMISRSVVLVFFILILSFCLRRFSRRPHAYAFFREALVVTACLFFLLPTGNPWYFLWVFPFLLFFPMRSLVLFSGLVFLYYMKFYFGYHDQEQMIGLVSWIEYSIFFVFVGWELWQTRGKFPLSSPFSMSARG